MSRNFGRYYSIKANSVPVPVPLVYWKILVKLSFLTTHLPEIYISVIFPQRPESGWDFPPSALWWSASQRTGGERRQILATRCLSWRRCSDLSTSSSWFWLEFWLVCNPITYDLDSATLELRSMCSPASLLQLTSIESALRLLAKLLLIPLIMWPITWLHLILLITWTVMWLITWLPFYVEGWSGHFWNGKWYELRNYQDTHEAS